MKAAVLHAVREPLRIEDVDVAAPGPREVVVRTAAVGVCHSDLHVVEGGLPNPLPMVVGHEAAGIVEAVGGEVQHVAPGDHVIACLSIFCGACEYCLAGRPNRCDGAATMRRADEAPRLGRNGARVEQFAQIGGFAERLLVHENALVRIRRDVPLDRMALIGCGVTTGLGAVFNTARIEPGASVAVIGCGGIGLSVVQGCRIAGAARIIAVDTMPWKLELATRFGATDTVNGAEGNPIPRVVEMTSGGADYAFEAIGNPATVRQAVRMTRKGGTIVMIGVVPAGTNVELPGADIVLREKTIRGCMMGSNRFRLDMPRYIELYRAGELHLDEMISARLPLEGVNDAFESMRQGTAARTVLVFE